MSEQKWISAGELMQQLESDPEWVARNNERQARHDKRASELADDEKSIISDLLAVGVAVKSVYDFVGQSIAPAQAIPILVRHLQVGHLRNVREGIIRALGVPHARQLAFEPLRSEYMHERDPNLRWVIVNALAGMVNFAEVKDLPGIEQYAKLFA